MQIDRLNSHRTTRQQARDKAESLFEAMRLAKLELGPRPSRAKLAYFVTGLGILTKHNKRWSGQTIADVMFIDDIQRESVERAMEHIRYLYPDRVEEWEVSCAHEIAEAKRIGEGIRHRLGFAV